MFAPSTIENDEGPLGTAYGTITSEQFV